MPASIVNIYIYVPGISCQFTATSDTGMEKCSAICSSSTSNALDAIAHNTKAKIFTNSLDTNVYVLLHNNTCCTSEKNRI